MGTEVLRPQDCLVDRLRVSPPAFHRRRSSFLAGNGFVSPKPNNRKTANVYRTTTTTTEQQPDHWKRKPIKEFQQLQRKPAGSDLSRRRSSSAEDLLQTRISKTVTNLHNPEFESGRITILRRGQSLESFEKNIQNEARKIKTQNDSEKKVSLNIMNHLSTDVYAGSGFFVSPSPNSLPLPSFFSNNKKIESDNCATRDLRRLLGLE